MKLQENLMRIERIDQLIRLEATGTPKELANFIGISERQVYRLIEQMKSMGATINYSVTKKSYIYKIPVKFAYGFFTKP